MEPDKTAPQGKIPAAPFFLCLLLVAATLAGFWPAIHCDFLNYDDPDYFTFNTHVLTGLTPGNVVWAFTTGHASNWHPVTWLSLMLDAELFGKGPVGPHLTNLLFHAANTVLLFLLLWRLTTATWRSALVAALFALHPLHVESVAWVTERKDVLSAFFGLLSLGAYARFVEEFKVQNSKSKVFFTLSLLFFALGLMSKPVLVTLPLVMLLLDWWPLHRSSEFGVRSSDSATFNSLPGQSGATTGQRSTLNQLVLEKWPFIALSAISCLVTFVVQQKGGAVVALTKFSLPERVENAFVSYARYLGKVFWPTALATPYPHPGHWPLWLVLFAVVLFAVLCVVVVRWGPKFPFAPVGWFWFVGMLVPVIGLVQVSDQSMADRYTYLPLIGVFMVLVWGVGEACLHWRVPKQPVIFWAAFMLAACALRTRDQLGYWQNSGTFFRHALAVTKNNYVAENDLGTWLSSRGQIAEAMDCFRQSLKIKPDNADALYNLGNAFARLSDWDNAIADYRRALQITPDQPDILDNLGFALAAKRQFTEAIANFDAALKLNPDSASAHNNLATVLFIQHRFDEAEQHYRAALRFTPDNPQIYANLGDTLVRLGRIAEAVECYQAALRLKPDDPKIKAKLQALGASDAP
ncbi:MAG: tetratricopeptide repeat protein [Verrucomicrobiota bacterium]|jgi:Tfp pilus assembly protein PilF